MAATTTRTHRHSSKCTFVERENEDGKDETRDDEKKGNGEDNAKSFAAVDGVRKRQANDVYPL